jgi:hypothetical protein
MGHLSHLYHGYVSHNQRVSETIINHEILKCSHLKKPDSAGTSRAVSCPLRAVQPPDTVHHGTLEPRCRVKMVRSTIP